MADKYASFTPYNYSFNAPSNFNDRNGADPSPGEPDHVTRRGYQVLMANFDTAFPSGGGSGTLFDNIWGAGGFNNIGGIANGNQQLQDFYGMTTDQYVDKYGTKVSASSYGSYANAYNNLIVSRLSVSLSQNGASYGYNVGLNVAGKVVYADRSILTNGKGTNATIFDLGGYYSEVVASRLTQGSGSGDGFEKFGVYDAVGFGADMSELYRQGYGAVQFGMRLGKAEQLLADSRIFKTMSAGRQAFNSSVSAFKTAGRGIAVIGAAATLAEFFASKGTGGDYAKLAVGAIIIGTAFIPVAGPFISVGLGLLDGAGAFDGFYQLMDTPGMPKTLLNVAMSVPKF